MGPVKEREVHLGTPTHLVTSFRLHRLGRLDPTFRLTPAGLRQALHTSAGPAVLELRTVAPEADGRASRVAARAWGPGADLVLERAPRILGADDAPERFVPGCAPTRRLVREALGLRLVRAASPFAMLLSLVFQQRVAWRDAARAHKKLVERHGAPAPGAPGLLMPPSPRAWARLPLGDFSALEVDRRRADTVRRIAKIAGHVDALFDAPPETARRKLAAVEGVGPWTREGFLGFALADPDALQTGDYDLPHRVAMVFRGTPRSDDAEMIATLEPYRGQRFRIVRLIHESSLLLPRFGPRRGGGRPHRR